MSIFSSQEINQIKENAFAAEEARSLSPQVMDILYRHKVFKLFVPKEMGGAMLPLPEALEVFEDCAYTDGTIGWLAAIGSGGNYFTGYYSPEIARRLFAGEKAVLAGSGFPGRAQKTEGGYMVNGSWKYCSGAGYATFYTANALITDDSGQPTGEILAFTFMPGQVTVVPDWNAFGLKATESHTMQVTDAFVPDELTFDLARQLSYKEEKIYSFPFLQFAQLSFAAVVLGLYKSFTAQAEAILQKGNYKTNPQRHEHLQQLLEEEKTTLNTLSFAFYEVAWQAWNMHLVGPLQAEELQEVSDTCHRVSGQAASISATQVPFLGMEVVMEHSLINKTYRDLLTANQHVLLKPFPF